MNTQRVIKTANVCTLVEVGPKLRTCKLKKTNIHKTFQILQVSDAVQQIGVLVEHELVTVTQNRQKPPPGFPPSLDVASLKQNPFSFVRPPALGRPGTRFLRELYQVIPVLEASEFYYNEKVVGDVGLGRPLDLERYY